MDAIEQLLAVLDAIVREQPTIALRAAAIRRERAQGAPYSIIVPDEIPPLIVERTRDILKELGAASGRLQRAEAQALHAEGLSMDRIESLFGLTRQGIADFIHAVAVDA